jgi:hypothetical protein
MDSDELGVSLWDLYISTLPARHILQIFRNVKKYVKRKFKEKLNMSSLFVTDMSADIENKTRHVRS